MSDTNSNKNSSMGTFLKNKEIIIGVIIIVIVAITIFYFVRKNREVTTKIDILAKKFEEQQQLLSKHDDVIGHLVGLSQRQNSILEQLAGIQDENPKLMNHERKPPTSGEMFHRPKVPSTPVPKIPNKDPVPNQSINEPRNQPPNLQTSSKLNGIRGNLAGESMFKNLTADFGSMMETKPKKTVSFSDAPARHFEPTLEEIEEESEPELEEGDDLDAELEEELRELQDLEEEKEDLNNKEHSKKK